MSNLKALLTNFFVIILSLLFGIAVCFAAGEAYYRLKVKGLSIDPPAEWVEFHKERGWALVPGQYNYFHVTAFREVKTELNSLGTRNPPLELAAIKNRISILGDSFTFADALNEDEKFTSVIQTLSGDRTEIVNISVPGYGTGQQLLFLNELVDKGYEAGSKIVLVFFTNDILDNVGLEYGSAGPDPRKPVFFIEEDGSLNYRNPADPENKKVSASLGSRSLFARFLKQRVELLVARYPWLVDVASTLGYSPTLPRVPGIINGWYTPGWEDNWAVTESILLEFQKRAKELTGNDLTVAFIPSPIQIEPVFKTILKPLDHNESVMGFRDNPNRPQEVLENFCLTHGIEFIDTTSALISNPGAGPAYFLREGHLNVLGSRIVGQTIFDSFKTSAK